MCVQEIHRLQLKGSVVSLAHAREDEFLAGDLLGSLYGVSPYEILWKGEMLQPEQTHVSGQPVDTEAFFYASRAQPFGTSLPISFQAISCWLTTLLR